jgi:hypothetical protein
LCELRLRCGWQRDRNARARGRVQRVMKSEIVVLFSLQPAEAPLQIFVELQLGL